jgi:hypothetical protein
MVGARLTASTYQQNVTIAPMRLCISGWLKVKIGLMKIYGLSFKAGVVKKWAENLVFLGAAIEGGQGRNLWMKITKDTISLPLLGS